MKRKILFLTTNLPGGSAVADIVKYREAILYVVKSFCKDEFQLTIKLHPAEQLNYYMRLLKKYSGCIKFLQSAHLYDLIVENDIIIGFPTTALLEAKKLGKICYYLNPWKTDLPYPYNSIEEDKARNNELIELEDISYFCDKAGNLTDIINEILEKSIL